MTRRIVANLDVERHWQRLLSPGRPMPALSRRALEKISAYGTLLRAFSGAGDAATGELWTPAPVDPERLTGALPRPKLVGGPVPDAGESGLAWGTVHETAAAVNHRRFAHELGERLGIRGEGTSAWVATEDQLLDALSPLERWVVKAPLSAAGRERVIGTGRPGEIERRRLRNLLARSGGLLVERWRQRLADFGVLFQVSEEQVSEEGLEISMHRQLVDPRGRFAGIELRPGDELPGLSKEHGAELRRVAHAVARALLSKGYRGPAGIDAWTYRREDGSEVLEPLGEINARLSFGWVARQIAHRLGRPGLRLRLGTGRELETEGKEASRETIVLLRPGGDRRDAAAWLTRRI